MKNLPILLSDIDDIQTASDAELIRMARLAAVRAERSSRAKQRHERIIAEMKTRANIPLQPERLVAGAIQAAKGGFTFDEYCELLSKIVISGQTVNQVRQLLINAAIDTYFTE